MASRWRKPGSRLPLKATTHYIPTERSQPTRNNPPWITPLAEENTVRACALREMPFITRASADDEPPFVAPLGYDNHSSVLAWWGEANNIPRLQTPGPADVPPREPHRNSVPGTSITFLPRENDTDSSVARPTTRLFLAAAEVGDVRLAGGGIASSLTTARVGRRTSPSGANRDITTGQPTNQEYFRRERTNMYGE